MKTIILILALCASAQAEVGVSLYTNGITKTAASATYVLKSGDVMSGPLQTSSLTVTGAISAASIDIIPTGGHIGASGDILNAPATFNSSVTLNAAIYGDGSHLTGISSGTLSGLTTNTIPKATAANALGDSLLTDNATTLAYSGSGFTVGGSTLVVKTGNVGIGNTAPTAKLDVAGNVSLTGQVISSGTGSNYFAGNIVSSGTSSTVIVSAQTGNPTLKFQNPNSTQEMSLYVDESADSMNIRDTVNATTRMVVKRAGNVGIGTASPASKLDISSGTITMAGTGAPSAGYNLCIVVATKQMGHCTDGNILTGGCTCIAN